MFPSLVRRSIKSQFNHATNPYKAKKIWPPDFSNLSNKHQFRLERRYRRRTNLKWARPNFMKLLQLSQWGILVYGVLFLELPTKGRETEEQPFQGVRHISKINDAS
ncbi:hypothetical protein P152DRAFT_387075 [Eremomyces bilateralis CBS 781.70]|uniref:Uncharacterized protein n=1 Tax=Eremomyces bilateralis CBS 781.70 TaxID=1392243 RepID=A0A6G1GHQ1_9PEZI|nr:uncharacterized protein P152DRAFT_387075 [Eremomyces bilateralis CBS 781.70]KAF1817625.1 hypothetical protein P152DRAFT_387075 [Eremomyces bilateralis CBS 781.70]